MFRYLFTSLKSIIPTKRILRYNSSENHILFDLKKNPKIHLQGKCACYCGDFKMASVGTPWSNLHPYCVSLGGSESSTVEINMSSELRDFDDADAEAESLENSLRN